ncbi:hypothetical protein, partial [Klebsiella michiganensis]|uniref:hypothetical protein n=1 Tax=Klebsiella michiganensis TaxID=1134687 RepID=UPI00345B722D
SFALSRWYAGGFPPTSAHLSIAQSLMEVPVCADNLSVALFSEFASSVCRKIPGIRRLFL